MRNRENITDFELKQRYNQEGSSLRIVQMRMLDILIIIDKICRKNNIDYWLCYGTLLGAVRHRGFIPWDDDIDIGILAKDRKRFRKIFDNNLPEKYVLQTHCSDYEYVLPFDKVRERNSEIKEILPYDKHYKYRGLYVDIFYIEPISEKGQKISELFFHAIQKITIISNKCVRRSLIFLAEIILNHIGYNIIRFVQYICNTTEYRVPVFPEPLQIDEIFPLANILFENHYFLAPANFDGYLRAMYGNYEDLPDEEDIVPHIIQYKDAGE